MGKVYAPPPELGEKPDFQAFLRDSSLDYDAYETAVAGYVESIRAWAKEHGKGQYRGEEVRFGVADGYARYIVFSLQPVILIWLPVHDAWQFQYVTRLTAADIKQQIHGQRAVKAMFSRKGAKANEV